MPAEPAISLRIRGKSQARHADRAIAELAERQHGVVCPAAADRPWSVGRWRSTAASGADACIAFIPGVYAVGAAAAVDREGLLMAAVLVGWTGCCPQPPIGGGSLGNLAPGSRPAHRDLNARGQASHRRRATACGPTRSRRDRRQETGSRSPRFGEPSSTSRGAVPVPGLEAAVREAQYRHGLDSDSLRRLLWEYRGQPGHRPTREQPSTTSASAHGSHAQPARGSIRLAARRDGHPPARAECPASTSEES